MTPTPVGMRCPQCARERTKVRTARSVGRGGEPTVTYALIAINVLIFLGTVASGGGLLGRGGGGTLLDRGALDAPDIAVGHDYWRLVTSGFLHYGLLHVALNMYFLYILGSMLEPAYGRARYIALYFTSLLVGALGALLLSPNSLTAGASGALFGLLGAAIVSARARGISIWQSGLGIVLVVNIAFTLFSPGISLGGHLGGLIGGLLVGVLIEGSDRVRSAGARMLPLAGCLALSIAAVAGSIIAAHAAVG